mmetsp:Transcript_109719/g.353926  ORF Transcript_109719/g.353926 Transcript_109719/m.353926 type:complete len:216 (-) Transcript_109719:528-1175(-)
MGTSTMKGSRRSTRISRRCVSQLPRGPPRSASRACRSTGFRPSPPIRSWQPPSIRHRPRRGCCGQANMEEPCPLEKSSSRLMCLLLSTMSPPRQLPWNRLGRCSQTGVVVSCGQCGVMYMKTHVPMTGSSGLWTRILQGPTGRKGRWLLSLPVPLGISSGPLGQPRWPPGTRALRFTVRSTPRPPLAPSSAMRASCRSSSTHRESVIGSSRRRSP